MTSIIILSFNTLPYSKQCIESIRQYTSKGTYEIIVVENGSTDGSVEWLRKQADVRLLCNNENKGFPAGYNQGMKVAQGNNLLLLNSDILVTHHWLDNMLAALYSHDMVGAVGPMSNNARGAQQVEVGYDSVEEMQTFAKVYNSESNPSKWVPQTLLMGFCLLVKREVYVRVGLLDESFTPDTYEADDYSLRIWQAGFAMLMLSDTFIHHYGRRSFMKSTESSRGSMIARYDALHERNRRRFMDKWQIDPEELQHLRPEQIDFVRDVDCTRPRGVYCWSAGFTWKDQHLVKNTGILPFLLHKLYRFRAVMVGVQGTEKYPSLAYLPGLEMAFLPDGSIDSALAFLRTHIADMDLLILHGSFPYFEPILKLYRELRPDGKVYLETDPNVFFTDVLEWDTTVFRRLLGGCDVIGASCRLMKKHLGQKWPCVLECIPNGFYNLTDADLTVDFPSKENVILTVGRLGTIQKRTDILLKAFARVFKYLPGWRLRLVGAVEAGFSSQYEELCASYPGMKEMVEFAGIIQDRQELYREYQKAKLFVLSSQMEGGTPNVIAEALYGGCYIVTSAIDGAADATGDGRCGRVFPLWDDEALANILLELCNGPTDWESLGREARVYAESFFDWEKNVKRLVYLLYGEKALIWDQ